MGASCISTTSPKNTADLEYEKKLNQNTLRLPKIIIEKQNKIKENENNQNKSKKSKKSFKKRKTKKKKINFADEFSINSDSILASTSSSIPQNKLLPLPLLDKTRKSIENKLKLKLKLIEKSAVNSINSTVSDTNPTISVSVYAISDIEEYNDFFDDDDKFGDVLITPMPNLPIRFVKNKEIWNKELILFIKTLSNIVYNTSIQLNVNRIEENIIKLVLEYSYFDVQYKLNFNNMHKKGLWPQHYIINESFSPGGLDNKSFIIPSIRKRIIHSFNLQSIFEICGAWFNDSTKKTMKNYFVYGSDIGEDNYYKHYHESLRSRRYSTPNVFNDEHSMRSGSDTSTCLCCNDDMINPLKFKIYSNDIMICHKGFHIERHNEYYEEDSDIDIDIDGNDDDDYEEKENDYDNDDPSYFFTLLLLPPNQCSYKGGTYRFYGVGNDDMAHFDNTDDIKDMEQHDYVSISADQHVWSWIAFDKRVEYETDPILDGTFIVFKMDIDVWKRTKKEIKQIEESISRFKDIKSGQLLYKQKDVIDDTQLIQGNSNASSPSGSSSASSNTRSANICFFPYPVRMNTDSDDT